MFNLTGNLIFLCALERTRLVRFEFTARFSLLKELGVVRRGVWQLKILQGPGTSSGDFNGLWDICLENMKPALVPVVSRCLSFFFNHFISFFRKAHLERERERERKKD